MMKNTDHTPSTLLARFLTALAIILVFSSVATIAQEGSILEKEYVLTKEIDGPAISFELYVECDGSEYKRRFYAYKDAPWFSDGVGLANIHDLIRVAMISDTPCESADPNNLHYKNIQELSELDNFLSTAYWSIALMNFNEANSGINNIPKLLSSDECNSFLRSFNKEQDEKTFLESIQSGIGQMLDEHYEKAAPPIDKYILSRTTERINRVLALCAESTGETMSQDQRVKRGHLVNDSLLIFAKQAALAIANTGRNFFSGEFNNWAVVEFRAGAYAISSNHDFYIGALCYVQSDLEGGKVMHYPIVGDWKDSKKIITGGSLVVNPGGIFEFKTSEVLPLWTSSARFMIFPSDLDIFSTLEDASHIEVRSEGLRNTIEVSARGSSAAIGKAMQLCRAKL